MREHLFPGIDVSPPARARWAMGAGAMVLTLASLGAFSMGARAATAPPSAKAVTYTWSGKDAGAGVSTDWSDAKNWKGGKAPADGSTVNLVFPVLTCSDTPPCAASSDNDLTGLTIAKWTIDIGQGAVEPSPGQYEISGNGVTVEELTINSKTPTAGDIGNLATINVPITVTKNQAWTVNVTGNSQPEFQASPAPETSPYRLETHRLRTEQDLSIWMGP